MLTKHFLFFWGKEFYRDSSNSWSFAMAFVRASAWRAWALKCFITRFSSTLRWSPTNLYFFCSNLFVNLLIQIWNKFNYLFCSSASLPFGSWLIRVVRWHTSSWFSVQAAYTLGYIGYIGIYWILFLIDLNPSQAVLHGNIHANGVVSLLNLFLDRCHHLCPQNLKFLSYYLPFKHSNFTSIVTAMVLWCTTGFGLLFQFCVWPLCGRQFWSDAYKNRYPVWTDYSKILLWLTLSQTLKTSSYWSGDDGQCMKCLAQSQPQ